jgi:hypothetical protein
MAQANVVEILRGQLAAAHDQVRRLETAIAALEEVGFGPAAADGTSGTRGRRRRAGVAPAGGESPYPKRRGRPAGAKSTKGGRKRRRFSAETRAKMAAAQKARWAAKKRV